MTKLFQPKSPFGPLFTPKRVAKMTWNRRRKCVQFLLRLSELDPAALVSPERPGDVANLCSDLFSFGLDAAMLYDPNLYLQSLVKQVRANPKRTLGSLITKVKKLVAAVADGGPISLPIPAGSRLIFNGESLKLIELSYAGRYPAPLAYRIRADSTDTFTLAVKHPRLSDQWTVFLFNAMRQLDSEEGVMVRRCRYDGCLKVFLASRSDRRHCSHRCANAVAQANYRASIGDEAFKLDHARIARESYRRRKTINLPTSA